MMLRSLCLSVFVGALVALTVRLPPAAVPPPIGRDPACAAALAAQLGRVQVLACDPRGRGRAVVALRDLASARNVAVIVPGSDIDLGRLDDPRQPQHRPLGWARALAEAGGDDLVVMLWVGYPTPEGLDVDAASGRLAGAGAKALVRFVAGLGSHRHVTVIGHSYGAVVVALGAAALAVDDLVLLGSPGARATSVAELHTTARVWAACAVDDWIARVPKIRLGDLGHGTDPTSPAFGAHPLPATDITGHDGYFRPGSLALAGLTAVALGHAAAEDPASTTARSPHPRTVVP